MRKNLWNLRTVALAAILTSLVLVGCAKRTDDTPSADEVNARIDTVAAEKADAAVDMKLREIFGVAPLELKAELVRQIRAELGGTYYTKADVDRIVEEKVEAKVKQIREDVAKLKADYATMQGDVTQMKLDVVEIKRMVQQLQQQFVNQSPMPSVSPTTSPSSSPTASPTTSPAATPTSTPTRTAVPMATAPAATPSGTPVPSPTSLPGTALRVEITATPDTMRAGEPMRLCWAASQNAVRASVRAQPGQVTQPLGASDCREFRPSTTTLYRVDVFDAAGASVHEEVLVTVLGATLAPPNAPPTGTSTPMPTASPRMTPSPPVAGLPRPLVLYPMHTYQAPAGWTCRGWFTINNLNHHTPGDGREVVIEIEQEGDLFSPFQGECLQGRVRTQWVDQLQREGKQVNPDWVKYPK